MVKYIVSHKNPDTDTICASIVYCNFLKQKGFDSKPVRIGDLNNETKFVLEKFKVKSPEMYKILPKESEIILVDHNEIEQSIDNFSELNVVGIIDHHKFKLETSQPLFIRAEPLGSTCSIIAKMIFESGIEPSKEEASLLLSAIISDTLYFRSPTTTKEDRDLVEKLNKIAQIKDLESYSLDMFNAKSDLGDIPVENLIKLDYKIFDFNGKKFGIGFMETTNPNYGLSKKDKIVEKMKEIKIKENLSGILFSIVDILNELNLTLFTDNFEKEILLKVFNAKIEDDIANLGSRVSRKKQVVPLLEEYFK